MSNNIDKELTDIGFLCAGSILVNTLLFVINVLFLLGGFAVPWYVIAINMSGIIVPLLLLGVLPECAFLKPMQSAKANRPIKSRQLELFPETD